MAATFKLFIRTWLGAIGHSVNADCSVCQSDASEATWLEGTQIVAWPGIEEVSFHSLIVLGSPV